MVCLKDSHVRTQCCFNEVQIYINILIHVLPGYSLGNKIKKKSMQSKVNLLV